MSVEDRVKVATIALLESRGYRVTPDPPVLDTGREVILDVYGFRQGDPPDVIWVECKGDVNLSELIEGFARTEFACYQGGGRGMLAAPAAQIAQMRKYLDFFSQAPHVELLPIDDTSTQ